MLKSYIVQKDEETLIVSQHIPSDFGEESKNHKNLMKSYQLKKDYIKYQEEE
jgi:hypothetical protein